MKNKKHILFFINIFISINILAQKPTLFLGGIAHLGNGNVIKNSAISVLNGKFDIIADASLIRIDPSAFDTIYKITGKHVYPSFILPNTTLGLTEIGAVRATRDFRETGSINPNIRTIVAYNSDSKIIKTVRTNGVLIAQVTPRGGAISGQSSIMQLNGEIWEDAKLKEDDGIHLNWPASYFSSGWWGNPGPIKENKDYKKKVARLDDLFKKAKAYNIISNKIDLKLESMKGLFNGNKNLYIHVNDASDIRDAIYFSQKYNIEKTVIVGGEDAIDVISLLKKYDIPVILNRVHRLPDRSGSPIDEPYTQALELQKEGVLFCLSYTGEMEAMGSRNLPFTAGTTIAYGQEYEDAIKSITLNTAKILGVSKSVGSIEEGKDATFFISSGDALDMLTNNVEKAYIKGVEIDLNNDQKRLFNKYKN